MNQLGMVEPNVKNVCPAHFFSVNLKELFVYYGIKLNEFNITTSVMSPEIDLTIFVLLERNNFHSIFVELNNCFVKSLRQANGPDYTMALWYYLVVNFRRWVTRREKVPIMELVSPQILYDIQNTEKLIKIFTDKFDAKEWSNETLAENFDAAAVGMHITRLIMNNPSVCRSITFNDIAEIILMARRGNWKKLVEIV